MRLTILQGLIRDRTGLVSAALAVVVGTVGFGYQRLSHGTDYTIRLALPAAEQVRAPKARLPANAQPKADLAVSEQAPEPLPDPTSTPAISPRTKIAGMIPLRYSLAGGASAGDAIEVEKPVSMGGADAGRIALRIDGNARVYALGSRLATIIAAQSGEQAVPAGLSDDFVSLDALRAMGIAVRYDATRDRLILDPPAV